MTDSHTHSQLLDDMLKTEHERYIAEIQGWADEALARGDEWNYQRHLQHIARLEAGPKPWEHHRHAA